MATRSNVYIETEPGTYIGTYCHYDGYPKHMLTVLSEMTSDELRGEILMAGLKSGFKYLGDSESLAILQRPQEYIGDDIICYLHNPSTDYGSPDYIYIKQVGGSIKYRSPTHAHLRDWREQIDET